MMTSAILQCEVLQNGIEEFRQGVRELYVYLSAAATQVVTLEMLDPVHLRAILREVEHHIEGNQRLALPMDPAKEV